MPAQLAHSHVVCMGERKGESKGARRERNRAEGRVDRCWGQVEEIIRSALHKYASEHA